MDGNSVLLKITSTPKFDGTLDAHHPDGYVSGSVSEGEDDLWRCKASKNKHLDL